MSIKSDINLTRCLLYLYEVIRCQTISKAAEKNGIKASNLSAMISELEKQIGIQLLVRTPRGIYPTSAGKQIFEFVAELEKVIEKVKVFNHNLPHDSQQLNLFVSANLKLCGYDDFITNNPEICLNFVAEEETADIKLLNYAPHNTRQSITELRIGTDISQKIWVCCNEKNSAALKFFDFIVAKLLP